MMAEISGGPSLAEVQQLVQSVMPQPATTTPATEAIGGNAGTDPTQFAQKGHQHPRLTSTTYATLDGNGQAIISFSRSFTNKPGLNLTETDAATGSQPLVLRGLAWVQDAQNRYTGVMIEGRRAQMLPTINPLSGLLTTVIGVVNSVNVIVGQLTNYNVFGGSASGATVSVIAVARSDVSNS